MARGRRGKIGPAAECGKGPGETGLFHDKSEVLNAFSASVFYQQDQTSGNPGQEAQGEKLEGIGILGERGSG